MPQAQFMVVDTFATLFYSTAISPYLVSLILLTLLARDVSPRSASILISLAWLACSIVIRVFYAIDSRIEKRAPREIDWSEEVVLITGGAGGLGSTIAQIYGLRGISVAVVDILGIDDGSNLLESKSPSKGRSLTDVESEWEEKNCYYFKCDVSSLSEVEKLKKNVEQSVGVPTVLINNAAVVNGKSVLALSERDIRRSLDVNVMGHFNIIQTFMPAMLSRKQGGTIVTISSVLGYLGCAALADYTATKAAVTALHHSLTAELDIMGKQNIRDDYFPRSVRTVLVTPGQLSTQLFDSIATPSSFFGPVLGVTELAKAIVGKIDEGTGGEMSMPLYARWIGIMQTLPHGVKRLVRSIAGLDRAAWSAYRQSP